MNPTMHFSFFLKLNEIIIWNVPLISICLRRFLVSLEHSVDSVKWRFNVENNLNFSPHFEHSLGARFLSTTLSLAPFWLLRSASRQMFSFCLVSCCFPIARPLRLLVSRVVDVEAESVVRETGQFRPESHQYLCFKSLKVSCQQNHRMRLKKSYIKNNQNRIENTLLLALFHSYRVYQGFRKA